MGAEGQVLTDRQGRNAQRSAPNSQRSKSSGGPPSGLYWPAALHGSDSDGERSHRRGKRKRRKEQEDSEPEDGQQ